MIESAFWRFGLRFFGYIFSAIFSLLWGFLAFQLAEGMTDSTTARWVTFGLVTVFSLVLHKDYFKQAEFNNKAVP